MVVGDASRSCTVRHGSALWRFRVHPSRLPVKIRALHRYELMPAYSDELRPQHDHGVCASRCEPGSESLGNRGRIRPDGLVKAGDGAEPCVLVLRGGSSSLTRIFETHKIHQTPAENMKMTIKLRLLAYNDKPRLHIDECTSSVPKSTLTTPSRSTTTVSIADCPKYFMGISRARS